MNARACLLSGGRCSAQAQARADFTGRGCRRQRRGEPGRRNRRLDRLPDQAALRGGQPGGRALDAGTRGAGLFILLDVHRPWRKVKVTDSRTAIDFTAYTQELVDVHFSQGGAHPRALDNLTTQMAACRSPASAEPPRLPLPSQARQLVDDDKNREWRAAPSMPGSAHRQQRTSRIRNRCLGAPAQYSRARIKCMFTTGDARSNLPDAPGQRVKIAVTRTSGRSLPERGRTDSPSQGRACRRSRAGTSRCAGGRQDQTANLCGHTHFRIAVRIRSGGN
jgi:hypothetical protein